MSEENAGDNGRLYKTIVVDPPWQGPVATPGFRSKNKGCGKPLRKVIIPYQTMTGVQCAALRIPALAHEHAQLFLWCTSRTVGDAWLLTQLWGFDYRGLFVWLKPGLGIGRHIRHQCEFLLWAGRQGAPLVEPKKAPHQIQEWPKPKRHSEKPKEAYKLIKALSPAPRIDIFARQRRPGFEAYGKELPDAG